MFRSISADELPRGARQATGTHNVRMAVRQLTLHALRSRPLTAAHIATVARTVGEGIESCVLPPTAPVREMHGGAWAGLEDAVGEALLAVELAAREFAEGRAWLPVADRERIASEFADLDLVLGAGWGCPRRTPPALKALLVAVASHLGQASPAGKGAVAVPCADWACLEFSSFASGVLVGLSEHGHRGAAYRSH